MQVSILRLSVGIFWCVFWTYFAHADNEPATRTKEGNGLAYLDESTPRFPQKDFPAVSVGPVVVDITPASPLRLTG